ncbi:MAG TPA: hypothetical protein VH643_39030 [Gemmataceae bacterium]|jgi:hypothetical protein
MFACLPHLFGKFFSFVAKCEARRREAQYAARDVRRRQERCVRLNLEGLEERVVPVTAVFTGPTGGAFTNPVYWSTGSVPGSMDVADIPAGKYCVLNSTMMQTVAGLTVEGQLDVNSKLSVTTASTSSSSVFNVPTGGEVDVLASADLGGRGTLNGQIDAQGASVTFDPTSSMVLGNGVQLIGSGLYNIFGPVTDAAALSQTTKMVLSNNGSSLLGSLTGPGSLTDGGDFDWNGGTIGLTGSGGATFIASADLKLQGADTKTLSAGTLTNQCNGSDIGGTGGLRIMPGATFDCLGNPTCSVTIPTISTMGNGQFINDADGFFDENGDTTIIGNFSNIGTLVVGAGSSLTLSAGPGSVVGLDGTLQLNGDLRLEGSVTSPTGLIEDAGGGTLMIGYLGNTASLSVGSGYEALLSGNVEVTSIGTLTGPGEVYNNGKLTLDLGAATGIGSYQQTSAGTLVEQAAGPGMNSPLHVSGAAQLSGTLELDFIDGYTPKSGDAFTVLTAGSIGAHFDTTPDNMTVAYGPTGVTATEN